MLAPIPFEVPDKFASELASGALIRSGAILREAGSGKIVAHLQESGLAQNVLSNVIGSPFSPISALSSAGANVQLVQLQALMDGLKILQFTNLGATVAGIGISVVGFVLLNQKLNDITGIMEKLGQRVEVQFKDLRIRNLREHFSNMQGLFNRAEQAHFLTDSAPEWRRIASLMADESAFFRGELAYLIQCENFDREMFEPLTRSYALCNSGRIECLVLSRELNAAHRVAQDVANDYNKLFDPLIPSHLAHNSAALFESKEKSFDHLLKQEMVEMKKLVTNLRDVQDAALSKPYLIETLIDKNIDGYQYLMQLKQEKERPLLLLTT